MVSDGNEDKVDKAMFSGWISDRFGKRKLLMVGGYGLSNLIKPFFALSSTWGHVLFIRFADRFGKGIRTSPRDAILADTTTKDDVEKHLDLEGQWIH